MSQAFSRRRFLKCVAVAGAAFAVPQWIPGRALGKDGAVAPSERITLGGIGVGNRGAEDLSRFLLNADVQMVADADLQRSRRERIKADGRQALRQHRLRALSRNGRRPAARRYRRRADHDRRPLAYARLAPGRESGQGHLLRKAVQHDDRREPDAGRRNRPIRPSLSSGHAASQHREFPARGALGPHRKARRTEGGSRQHPGAADAQPVAARRTGTARPTNATGIDGSVLARGVPTTRSTSRADGAGSPTSTAAASSNGARTRSISASLRPDRTIRRRSSSGPTTTTSGSITPTGERPWPPRRRTSSTAGTPTASSS